MEFDLTEQDRAKLIFETECRALWRDVYARIVAEGSGGPRAKEYADNAVERYRESWRN